MARIKVTPKKVDCRLMDNLRPISILSVIGKILEKKVKRDLVVFFLGQLYVLQSSIWL